MAKKQIVKKGSRIITITAKNILAFSDSTFRPNGKSMKASGGNGKGKSSFLNLIAAAFGAEEVKTLIRLDRETGEPASESGEIVVEVASGQNIRRRVTAEGGDATTIKDPIQGTLDKPAALLKSIAPPLSIMPLRFLTATPEKRAKYLLEAMPIKLKGDDIKTLEKANIDLDGLDEASDHLRWLTKRYKEIFDFRTNVNRNIRDKEGTLKTLNNAVPDGDADKIKSEIEKGERLLAKTRDEYGASAAALEEGVTSSTAKIQDEYNEKIREIMDEKIAALKVITDDAEKLRTVNRDTYRPRISEIEQSIAGLRPRHEQAIKAQQTREDIALIEGEVKTLEKKSAECSGRLGKIDTVKESLMNRLPVKGLEFRGSEVFISGMPWDNVNTAKQVEIAFDLIPEGTSFTILDDYEHLDPAMQAAIEAKAEERDIQLFVGEVAGYGDLVVDDL